MTARKPAADADRIEYRAVAVPLPQNRPQTCPPASAEAELAAETAGPAAPVPPSTPIAGRSTAWC